MNNYGSTSCVYSSDQLRQAGGHRRFLKEKVPGVRVEFITDSTLLTDVRANGGPSQAVIDRMTLYAKRRRSPVRT